MSNSIIRKQLQVLSGEKLKVPKTKAKSPLDKIRKNKEEEPDILEENLNYLRKNAVLKKESVAAKKKRELVAVNLEKQKQKYLDSKKARVEKQRKKNANRKTLE
ncbi:hypothetical protein DLAC_07724 [Tieghemostelium lacteum]|uniref:Uncharacterized protein n=1 Tax=Tieghemostelium lacteum TaxID=361077 RepID=A0A151ZAA0_TIELA|nr:hypothetical protein DLAC_07724 [Tieghemostelium lacteum]|eukprot:KYQ90853.1 hypothetical protein DLAC_07724 [Tieghemostelium lacteum]